MKRAANIIACLMFMMVLDTAHVCHGFSIRPCSLIVQHHSILSARPAKNPLWSLRSSKTKYAFQTSLAVRAVGDDGNLKRTWTNVKFGASYVNDNYLDLLVYTLLRMLLVVNALWLTLGVAFSLSPTMAGPWTLCRILKVLRILSQSTIVFVLPFMIPFALVLLFATRGFVIVTSFLLFCKNMLESTGGLVLQLCLLAPILEELQYRLMYDRINRWFAKASVVKRFRTTSSSESQEKGFNCPQNLGASFLRALTWETGCHPHWMSLLPL